MRKIKNILAVSIIAVLVLTQLSCSKDEGSLKIKVTFAKEISGDVKISLIESGATEAYKEINTSFSSQKEKEILLEELPLKEFTIKGEALIDSVEYNGEVTVTIEQGEEVPANLTMTGNAVLEVLVKTSDGSACCEAEVFVYTSEAARLADNWSWKAKTPASNCETNGAVIKNLPFNQYYLKAKWVVGNDIFIGTRDLWLQYDEEKTITIKVYK